MVQELIQNKNIIFLNKILGVIMIRENQKTKLLVNIILFKIIEINFMKIFKQDTEKTPKQLNYLIHKNKSRKMILLKKIC